MEDRYLDILGRVEERIISLIQPLYSVDLDKEVVVYVGYCNWEVPLYTTFSKIKTPQNELHEAGLKLKFATWEAFTPFATIPEGYKTICVFELLDDQAYSLVYQLPVIKSWIKGKIGFVIGEAQ